MIGLVYEQCRAVGGKLDRSFHRGFDSSKCKVLPQPQYEELPGGKIEEKTVKDYVLRHHKTETVRPSRPTINRW